MSDLSNIVISVGGAIVSKDLVSKLLGPTASYLGDGLLGATKKMSENLTRIVKIAVEKTGPRIDDPGATNARVFKNVFDEGRVIDDIFAAEYFGGILASSRSEDGSDDSGLPLLSLIKSLSTIQLRLHFTLYSLVNKHAHFLSSQNKRANWRDWKISIRAFNLLSAIGMEDHHGQTQIAFAAAGLVDSGLVDEELSYRLSELRNYDQADPSDEDYLAFTPTDRGAALYLRALGLMGLNPDSITIIVPESTFSDELKASIRLPADFSVLKLRKPSPQDVEDLMQELRDDLESRIDSLESDIEDVRTQVEDDDDKPTPPKPTKKKK